MWKDTFRCVGRSALDAACKGQTSPATSARSMRTKDVGTDPSSSISRRAIAIETRLSRHIRGARGHRIRCLNDEAHVVAVLLHVVH